MRIHSLLRLYRDGEWWYAPHEAVLAVPEDTGQDSVWKFTISSAARSDVLRFLDSSNLNAYSLFGTEDALMQTMAVREMEKIMSVPTLKPAAAV